MLSLLDQVCLLSKNLFELMSNWSTGQTLKIIAGVIKKTNILTMSYQKVSSNSKLLPSINTYYSELGVQPTRTTYSIHGKSIVSENCSSSMQMSTTCIFSLILNSIILRYDLEFAQPALGNLNSSTSPESDWDDGKQNILTSPSSTSSYNILYKPP